MISLFVGEFGQTAGWRIRRCRAFNTVRVGVDYILACSWRVGTLLAGINLLVTIIKMRALGMGMMKMPIFTWTALCTNMIVASFPVLTACWPLLSMDRYLGTVVFFERLWRQLDVRQPDLDLGPPGSTSILPLFGVFSEVARPSAASACSAMVVYATLVITILSMSWLHHFFTMGSGRA
jgi:cytochrome o ubiquinol oxidase subunit 1